MQFIKYTPERKKEWDQLVLDSRNGSFQFFRDYLEYKNCQDESLMLYDENLVAIVPIGYVNNQYVSHPHTAGGGVIFHKNLTSEQIVKSSNFILTSKVLSGILIKQLPVIFHRWKTTEDIYTFITRGNAKINNVYLSSYINLFHPPMLSELRKRELKKPITGLIGHEADLDYYWEFITNSLWDRYQVKPTHTLSEIKYLTTIFPNYIKHISHRIDEQIVGGITLFQDFNVCHAQYSLADELGFQYNSMTRLHNFCIKWAIQEGFHYYSFGRSDSLDQINYGLLRYKNSFGSENILYHNYILGE